ncbi:hypothetical protein [Pseudarthrobacter sulfonivorans]|uniref:hypothetical protein n=1 Tax=Pseudarthrobacter sulfonivorans TaxID=121292 RepID=UPI0027E35A6F|nr:hypothetical protein [Pseudarthrobacter sulfonivorans]
MPLLIAPDVSFHSSWLAGASAALAAALPIAWDLGITRALLTCNETNAGSRATIERNGGVYEDTRNGKRRYWLECGAQ